MKELKNLPKILDDIEKVYGKGSIMRPGDPPQQVEFISSGSLSVDIALGVGGWPRGRIIEIYGPESSGKTTLAIHALAQVHKYNEDFICGFIDAEHAFDLGYAKNLGLDEARLYISQPDNGEQALDIVEKLVKSNEVQCIVVDSVAALTPKAEIDGDMGDSNMGLHARLMSQAMRKLAGLVSKNNVTLIFINQLREKIGVMFGSPETTTGGNALKFYASIRVDIRKMQINKDQANVAQSNKTKVKIVKNKVAPPFRECEVEIVYGKGIDYCAELVDLGVVHGLVKKSGSWFSYGDVRLGQGREAVVTLLRDNLELQEELDMKIKDIVFEVEN